MQIDYDQLAKKFFEQFNGSIRTITLKEFTDEYKVYAEQNKAVKTCEGISLVIKHLLGFYPATREVSTIETKDAEKFLQKILKQTSAQAVNELIQEEYGEIISANIYPK